MGGLSIEENRFIAYIIEFIVVFLSLFYLKKIPINAHSLLLSALVFTISMISAVFLQQYMAIIVFLVSLIVMLLYFNNFDFLNVSYSLFLIIILGMISDHVTQLIQKDDNIFIHLLFFVPLYFLLFFIFIAFNEFYRRKSSFTITGMSRVFITFLLTITVIVLYLNIFIPTSYSEIQLKKINLVIQISYLIIISSTFAFFVKTIKREHHLKNQKRQQDLFTQYMNLLEAVNLDMQKFRHDYLNILVTMERYIDHGDIEGLKTYFQDKILKTEQATLHKNALIKDLANLDIIELKGLLLTKLLLALEKKLNIQVEIPEKVKEISMDIIDLSRIVGILIDNAIEASVNSIERIVNIAIIKMSNSTLIIIENSFNDETFDIHKIYQENYSNVNSKRGYGLKNVSGILSNYTNVLLHTSIENHMFIQEIEILK